WEEASEAYLTLLRIGEGNERAIARLGLGLLEVERARPEDALRYLKATLLEAPSHWSAQSAQRQAKLLLSKNPTLEPLWKARSMIERLKYAEALASAERHEQATERFRTLLFLGDRLPAEIRCRALYGAGRGLSKRRKRREAMPLLRAAATLCPDADHDQAPWALFVAGLNASRLNLDEEADRYFLKLYESYPAHRLADDGAFHLIRHLLREPDGLERAMPIARRLAATMRAGDMSSEAIFFVFVEAVRRKDWVRAAKLLKLDQALESPDFRHRDGGRNLYWSGRVALQRGEAERAEQLWRATINSAPLSWYALLAWNRIYDRSPERAKAALEGWLNTRPTGPDLPSAEQAEWKFYLSQDESWPQVQRALLWLRLGVPTLAQSAMNSVPRAQTRPELLWLRAWIFDHLGFYHWSHDILRRDLFEYRRLPPRGNHLKHWRLAFPRPFSELVKREAAASALDPAFIWGVMREESGFVTDARSWASAQGLMQLIVGTAKQMSRSNEPRVTRELLNIPEVNVRLGSRYLAWVQRRLSCQFVLVPSGYNAGAGALKRWLRERGALPLDLFVETIPYEEARWYLKRVVSSWITYRTLYGAPEGEPLWLRVTQANQLPRPAAPTEE
ncbi:MAG: lytic transglycosylase domain-containing protein, partial [Myxococcota bacterium]|nr:lytic transglycosylase domain-containing protein [Myxococcota bacterium]